jgi:peptidase E
MTSTRQIIAIGGATTQADVALFPYVVAQARRPRPRVSLLPTASGDSDAFIAKFYAAFSGLACEPSHLTLFDRVRSLETYIPEQDIILVSGGNTKSMLALWREWGLDVLLRQAWDAGTILAGFSAGAVCWFSEGLSDAWADRLVPVAGLDFLAGSCCPHYSNEPERRPAFQRLVTRGEMAPGLGIDDGAAVHYRDTRAVAIVTARAQANAYVVAAANGVVSETALEVERIRLGAG